MVGDELAIEQGETAGAKPRHQPGQRDLGCVPRSTEHAFAEEGATQANTIDTADQCAALPHLDAVGAAEPVEVGHGVGDRRIDPRLRPVRATFEHAGEVAVASDRELTGAHSPRERSRHMEALQWQDRPFARLDPEQVLAVAALGHREDAGGVALKDEAEVEHGHEVVGLKRRRDKMASGEVQAGVMPSRSPSEKYSGAMVMLTVSPGAAQS